MTRRPIGLFRKSLLSTAIAGLVFSPAVPALGNPVDATVVRGTVDFATLGNELTVTNTPGAIIDWQAFSIAQDEITRFQQQAASSAVLNRVIGGDVSEILGQLVSNGQVFLINPNGMVFGQDVTIDTAGFVASTLAMSNEDFINGDYVLEGDSGRIVNEGYLTTRGGNVFFVAPDIENSGVIHTEDGSLVLAAGERVRITSLDTPDIDFEVVAPDNEIVNLGAILADQGAVNAFAGTLTHSGEIRANNVSVAEDGSIVLSATGDITLAEASIVDASGADGGDILVQSATGTILGSGAITADGTDGTGGRIRLLGDQVGLLGAATISADGTAGGGQVLLGGNLQGLGPEPNASAAFVGSGTRISASATDSGDGGEVIVFSQDLTRVYGELAATGGPDGGDGGFIETSGDWIEVTTTPDASAANGAPGEWLIDPDLFVIAGAATAEVTEAPSGVFTVDTSAASPTIGDQVIETAIDGGTSVSIITAADDNTMGIQINEPLDFNATAAGLSLNFDAANGGAGVGTISINQAIINTGTQSLDYNFLVGTGAIVDFGADLTTGAGGSISVMDFGGSGTSVSTFNTGVTVNGDLFVDVMDVTAGNNVFNGGLFAFDLSLIGGTAELNQLSAVDFLTIDNGNLLGTAELQVGLGFDWTGSGDMGGSGVTRLFSGISATISGASSRSIDDTRTLLIDSGANLIWIDGTILMSGDSRIENNGTFDAALDATARTIDRVSGGDTPRFINNDTFTVSGTQAATIDVAFDNSGTTTANGAELHLSRGGTSTGSFSVGIENTLRFGDADGVGHMLGGAQTGSGTMAFSGSGSTSITGSYNVVETLIDTGSVEFDVNSSSTNVSLNGGFLGGTGDLTISDNLFWQGTAAMGGSGTTVISNFGGWQGTGTKTLRDARTLRIDSGGGLWIWDDGNVLVQDTATIDVFGDFTSNLSGTNTLDFNGGTPSFTLRTGATFSAISGGTTIIDIDAVFSGATTLNNSTLRFTRTSALDFTFAAVGAGALEINSGNHTLGNAFGFSDDGAGTFALSTGEVLVDAGAAVDISALLITGGVLGGDGDVTISDVFDFNGGDLGRTGDVGSLTVTAPASAQLGTTATKEIRGAWQLINEGALNWAEGSLTLSDTANFTNNNILDINIGANATLDQAAGTPTFVNTGTITKPTANVATLFIDVDATVGGTVNIDDGTLQFTRGGAYDALFTTTAPGLVQFSGANVHNWNTGLDFGGDGFVEILSGTTLVNAAVTADMLRLSGGALGGDGDLTVTDAFEFLAGDLGRAGDIGSLTLTSLATGSLLTTSTKEIRGDWELVNDGSLTWFGGNLSLSDTARFTNNMLLDINLGSNATLDRVTGTPDFVNTGTITKGAGNVATLFIDVGATVGGIVNIDDGTLQFTRGGAYDALFTTTAPGLVQFSGADGHNWNTGLDFGGDGFVEILSGTTLVNAAVTADMLRLSGGVLGGDGDLTVTDAFEFLAGDLGRAGDIGSLTLTSLATGSLLTTTTKEIRGDWELVNDGSITWSGGNLSLSDTARFTNNMLLDINLGSNATLDLVAGTPDFVNTGTITKGAGNTATLTVDVPAALGGMVNVDDGILAFTRGGSYSASFTTNDPGLIQFGGTATHNWDAGLDFAGNGFADIISGLTLVNATVEADHLRLTNGVLAGNGALNLNTTFAFLDGSIGRAGDTGLTTITAGATASFESAGTKDLAGDGMLLNLGVLRWVNGNVNLADTVTLQNDGSFDIELATGRVLDQINGAPSFVSTGSIDKNANAASAIIDVTSDVSGSVTIADGVLEFSRGGITDAIYTMNAASATVRYSASTMLLETGISYGGAGLLELTSTGRLQIDSGLDVAIDNLSLNGSSVALGGNGGFRVADSLLWNFGTVSDSTVLELEAGGTGSLALSSKAISDSAQFLNSGNLTWNDGTVSMSGTASFINAGSMTIDLPNDFRSIDFVSGTPLFGSSGTLTNIGATIATIDVDSDVSGTVNVNDGTLNFTRGGTHAALFNIAASGIAQYNLGNAPTTLLAGAQYTGAGNLVLANTATVLVDNGVTVDVDTLQFVNNPTLAGNGTVRINDSFLWTANGTLGQAGDTGTTIIMPIATATLSDSPSNRQIAGTHTLINDGILNWTGGFNVNLDSTAVLRNNGVMNVDLTISRSIGASPAAGGVFENDGQLNLLAGSADLRIATDSLHTTASTMNIQDAAVILSFPGTHTFEDSATITGAGQLATGGNGHDISIPMGVLNVPDFRLDGGTVVGAGELQVADSFTWSNGDIGDATLGGNLRLLSGASGLLSTTSFKDVDNGLLTIDAGAGLTWEGGPLILKNGSVIENSGDFFVATDAVLSVDADPGNFFQNTGSFFKTGVATGSSDINVALDNDGFMQATTGIIVLNGDGVHDGDFLVTPPGDIILNGTHTINGTFTTSVDTVVFDAETLIINGAYNANSVTLQNASDITFNGTYSATETTVNASTLTLNDASMSTNLTVTGGGVLQGSGAFDVPQIAVLNGAIFDRTGTTTFWTPSSVSGSAVEFNGSGDTALNGLYSVADTTIRNGTVTFGVSGQSTGDLTLDSGILSISNDFTVGAAFTHNGGVVEGPGTFNLAGSAELNGGSQRGSGTTFINAGVTANQNAGYALSEDRKLTVFGTLALTNAASALTLNDNSILAPQAGGLVDIQDDGSILDGGNAVGFTLGSMIDSTGTVRKSGGVGESFLSAELVGNEGFIDSQSGTIVFNTATTADGNYNNDAGMRFDSGDHELRGGASFTGANSILIGNADLLVSAGGSASAERLTLNGGSITSDGIFNISNSFVWNAGNLDGTPTGATVVQASAVATIQGGSNRTLANGRLIIDSAAGNPSVWSGGNIFLDGGGEIEVNGLLQATHPGNSILAGGGATGAEALVITPTGELQRNGANDLFVQVAIDNDGRINVVSGTMSAGNGGVSSGLFSVTGGSFNFSGGTNVLLGTAAVDGTGGFVQITGGQTTIDRFATVDATNLAVAGGVLQTNGLLQVNNDFRWTGGTISAGGGGITEVTSSASGLISGGATKNLSGGTLRINSDAANPTNWSGGNINVNDGALIEIGGVFSATNPGNFLQLTTGFTGAEAVDITATGTFERNGANTVFVDLPLNNDGRTNMLLGTLNASGGGISSGRFSANGGTLAFTGGTQTILNGASFDGTSFNRIGNGGTLVIDTAATVAATNIGVDGGQLFTDGALAISGGFQWAGGAIGGAGVTEIQATAFGSIFNSATKSLNGGILRINSDAANPTDWSAGNILVNNGAALEIGGVFSASNPGNSLILTTGFTGTEAVNITPSGTFERNGVNTVFLDFTLNNDGRTNMLAGTLNASGGGTSSGRFSANGGTLAFTGGTQTILDGASFDGTSFNRVNGSGTLVIDTAATVAATNIGVDGGQLFTDGALAISGGFQWAGGAIGGAGVTEVQATAFGSIFNTATKNLNGGILRIDSDAANPTDWSAGNILVNNGAVLEIGGVFSASNPGNSLILTTGSTGTEAVNITSSGTLERNGANTVFLDFALNNNGRTNMLAGSLNASGGGSSIGRFSANGGTFNFAGGVHVLSPGAVFDGTSFNRLNTGALIIDGDTTLDATNFAIDGGTLLTDGSAEISQAFTWNAGFIGGVGVTRVTSTGSALISGGTHTIDGGTLQIDSAAGNPGVWSGGNIVLDNGGRLLIGGLLDAQNPGNSITLGGSPTGAEFVDVLLGGTLRRNGANTVFVAPQVNIDGSIEVLAGGLTFNDFATLGGDADVLVNVPTLSFFGDGVANGSTFTVNSPGVLDFGSAFTLNNPTLLGDGTITGDFTVNSVLTSIDSPMTFSNADIATTGTLAVNAALTLEGMVNVDGDVTNNDLILIQGTAGFGNALVTLPSLNNLGTLVLTTVDAGFGAELVVTGDFTSTGNIDLLAGAGGGIRTLEGGLQLLGGTLDVETNATLDAVNATSVAFSGGVANVINGALLEIQLQNNSFSMHSGFQLNLTSGNVTLQDLGEITPPQFQWNGGTLSGAGTFDARAATTSIQGSTPTVDGALLRLQELNLAAGQALTASNGATIDVAGSAFINGGSLTLNGSSLDTVTGAMLNSGTLTAREADIGGAPLTVQGSSAFLVEDDPATMGTGRSTVADLEHLGGNLMGDGLLAITNSANLGFTTQSGTGTTLIETGATATISSQVTLEGTRTLENRGALQFTEDFSQLFMREGAVLLNASTGSIDFANDGSVLTEFVPDAADPQPATRITNDGSITKSAIGAGSGTSLQAVTIQQRGTISANAGQLFITPVLRTEFDPATNTVTTIIDGTATHAAGATLVGTPGSLQLDGARHLFQEGALVSGGFTLQSATLEIDDDPGIGGTGTLTLTDFAQNGGDVTGDGDLLITSSASFESGTQSGMGSTIIGSGATATLNNQLTLSGNRTLENRGALVLPGDFSRFFLREGAVLLNTSTGSIDFAQDGDVFTEFVANPADPQPTTRITNEGTITKSGTGSDFGTSLDAVTIEQRGTISANAGQLFITPVLRTEFDPATNTVTTLIEGTATYAAGSMLVGTPGSLQLNGARHLFQEGALVTGGFTQQANILEIDDDPGIGGTGTLTLADLVHEGGEITGDGDLLITNSASFDFSTQSGMGSTIIGNGATATLNNQLTLSGNRTLENRGALVLPEDFSAIFMRESSILLNTATGSIDFAQDGDVFTEFVSNNAGPQPTTRITNEGTITKSGVGAGSGSGLEAVTIEQRGTISANAGQVFITPVLRTEFDPATNTNTTIVDGIATYSAASMLVGTPGSLQLNGGRHLFQEGALVTGGFTQQSATLEIDDDPGIGGTGTLTLADLVHQGGEITGDGNLLITNSASFDFGTQSGMGSTIIGSGATATLNSQLTLSENRTLENRGALAFPEDFSSVFMRESSAFVNTGSGTVDFAMDGGIFTEFVDDPAAQQPATRITNDGVITKSGAGTNEFGATTLNAVTIEQRGTINANTGDFRIDPVFHTAFDSETNTSTTLLEGTATHFAESVLNGSSVTLTLGAGRHVFPATPTINGGFTLRGTLAYDDDPGTTLVETLSLSDFVLAFGTVEGSGNLDLTGNARFEFGTLRGTGKTVLRQGAASTNMIVNLEDGRALVNEAALTVQSVRISSETTGSFLNSGSMTITGATEVAPEFSFATNPRFALNGAGLTGRNDGSMTLNFNTNSDPGFNPQGFPEDFLRNPNFDIFDASFLNTGSIEINGVANGVDMFGGDIFAFGAAAIENTGSIVGVDTEVNTLDPDSTIISSGTLRLLASAGSRPADRLRLAPCCSSVDAFSGRVILSNEVTLEGGLRMGDGAHVTLNTNVTVGRLSVDDFVFPDDPEPPTTATLLDGTGSIMVSEDFRFVGGTIALNGTVTVADGALFTIGNTFPAESLDAESALQPFQINPTILSGTALINASNGKAGSPLRNQIAGDLTLAGGANLTNNGVLFADTTFSDQAAFDLAQESADPTQTRTAIAVNITGDASSSFVNAGTLTTTFGTDLSIQTAFTNTGTIELAAGGLAADSLTLSGGALNLGAGQTATLVGLTQSAGLVSGPGLVSVTGSASFTGGSQTGAGITRIASGATASVGGSAALTGGRTLDNTGALALDALVLLNNALLLNSGAVTLGTGPIALTSAGIVNAGTMTLGSTTATISGDASSSFSNTGTVSGAGSLQLGANTTQSGTLTTGALQLTAGDTLSLQSGSTTTIAGDFASAGTLTLAGGALTVGLLQNTGIINGTGTLNGDLSNSGLITPGFSPGSLNVNGDFVQTADGTLLIEIDGAATTPGTDFDLLAITGNATFGGTLQLATLGNFQGTLGAGFTPVSFATASGNFATVVQPSPDLVFDPVIGANGIATTLIQLNGQVFNPDPEPEPVDPTNPPTPENEEQARDIADEVLNACPEERDEVDGTSATQREQQNQESNAQETAPPSAGSPGAGSQGVGCTTG